MSRIICRILLLLLIAAPTYSQPAEDEQAMVPVGTAQVRITATQLQNPPEIPANFRIPFSVINGSSSPLLLRDFRARFLIPSGAFRENHDNLPDAPTDHGLASAYCPHPERSIPAGAEEIILCEFQSSVILTNALDLGALASNWSTLTFKPGKYQIHAIARLRQVDQDGENMGDYITSSIVEVDLHPSIWQVVLGVLLGAFLLAAFRIISGHHPKPSRKPTLFHGILQGAGLTFSGWIAGSMLVFMTFRMSDVGFPIAISVSDFYGGVVVGLFSYLSALWLLEKLLPARLDADTTNGPKTSGSINGADNSPMGPDLKAIHSNEADSDATAD